MFSTAMVQALLAGRKTQTRRTAGLEEINKNPDDWQFEWADYALDKPWRFTQLSTVNEKSLADRSFNQVALKCPYGWAGDELWVRENWTWEGETSYKDISPIGHWWYQADNDLFGPARWKPSIHMPREASRFLLKVKHIKPQRIADISESDCISEGIEPVQSFNSGEGASNRQLYKNYLEHGYTELLPKDSFISLWQSINGKPKPVYNDVFLVGYETYPFDTSCAVFDTHHRNAPLHQHVNPWVWVVEFEIIDGLSKKVKVSEVDDDLGIADMLLNEFSRSHNIPPMHVINHLNKYDN